MKSKLLISLLVSFLLGVFLYSWVKLPFWVLISMIAWFSIGLLLFFNNKILLVVMFSCISVLFGYIRYDFFVPVHDEQSVSFYQNEFERRLIKGVISEDPDRRRDKVNYIVDVDGIYKEGEWQGVKGRVLISQDLYPEYFYGDEIEINGYLIAPAEFETFSYKNYLSLFSVYSVMYRPRIDRISKNNSSIFYKTMFDIKSGFEERLNFLFPEPMASFEAGLLTGSRKGIPEDLLNSFNRTGLTHIIAISGYNISLIIVLISSLFKNLSRTYKIPLIIIFITLFTLFVGASAAVVRASIMGIISVLALWFGRQSQIMTVLLMSAALMVLWNPPTLLFDVGFQLSFLATLGLIITGNNFMNFFKFLPNVFGLREAFSMTLSAQVFALPVILLNFKRFSLISPIANIFVVPLIPIAMVFGFVSVVLSMVSFHLGFAFTFPAWLVLKIAILITHFLANLPFASFETPWFSVYHLIGYYLFIVLFTYFIYPYLRNVLLRL